jgi:K+-transporting ATPase ATPase C chain
MTLFRPALVLLTLLSAVAGVAYPLAVTAVARVLFPSEAAGSLIVRDGAAAGSSLIGQPFDDPRYLWGRLSATAPFPYNAGASSGSNLGPLNPALETAVAARVKALREAGGGDPTPIPVDLVTASGSGLDPDVSPAAAAWQVPRVARARGLPAAAVAAVVARHTAGRQLGFLGEPRVSVLAVNLALDAGEAK